MGLLTRVSSRAQANALRSRAEMLAGSFWACECGWAPRRRRTFEKRLEVGDAKVARLRAGPRDEGVHARPIIPLHIGAREQRALRMANQVKAAAQLFVGADAENELLELPLQWARD